MTLTYLRRGKSEADRVADDAEVSATVEGVLAVILGHRNMPVQSVGCHVTQGQVPDGGLGTYVGADSGCCWGAADRGQRATSIG